MVVLECLNGCVNVSKSFLVLVSKRLLVLAVIKMVLMLVCLKGCLC